MTNTQRFHSEALAESLRLRDQGICRTPWCDAPIAQSDHINPHDAGGETSAENGQGLCHTTLDLTLEAIRERLTSGGPR